MIQFGHVIDYPRFAFACDISDLGMRDGWSINEQEKSAYDLRVYKVGVRGLLSFSLLTCARL